MISKNDELLIALNIIRLSYEKQHTITQKLGISSIKELIDCLYQLPFDSRTITKLDNRLKKLDLENYLEKLDKLKIKITTMNHENYPKNLKEISYSPPVLYYKGVLKEKYGDGLAIVGSRKATDYGRFVCEKIVKELSFYDIPIISGLAYGIDGIAHSASLLNGNATIGILGNSVDIIYPKKNKNLYKQMEDCECVLSEFPITTQPLPYNFPQRNHIISGMSNGVIVIEAEEKSGTLITASAASEQGREVFAIPGDITKTTSRGTNRLIQDGAKLVMGIEDIIEELPFLFKRNSTEEAIKGSIELEASELQIYEALREKPKTVDELCFEKNMQISVVLKIITILELKGYIVSLGDKYTLT